MQKDNINTQDLEDVLDFEKMKENSYRCNWEPKNYSQQHNWVEPKKEAVLYKTFPFGKYKKRKISKVWREDRGYVEWFIENVKFKELVEDIKKQIPRKITKTTKKPHKPFKQKNIARKKKTKEEFRLQMQHMRSISQSD